MSLKYLRALGDRGIGVRALRKRVFITRARFSAHSGARGCILIVIVIGRVSVLSLWNPRARKAPRRKATRGELLFAVSARRYVATLRFTRVQARDATAGSKSSFRNNNCVLSAMVSVAILAQVIALMRTRRWGYGGRQRGEICSPGRAFERACPGAAR